MNIVTRVYYTFEATDVHNPPEHLQKTAIPATAGFDDPFDWKIVQGGSQKLKTKKELIKLAQDFCKNVYDFSAIYDRVMYQMQMRRNAWVFVHDNNLGGVDIDNAQKILGHNDGVFNFVYNKKNKIMTLSNICDVMECDFEYIFTPDPNIRKMIHAQDVLDKNQPLYVCRQGGNSIDVKPLDKNTIVVDDKLRQIYPETTGRIPAQMSWLFDNKTEVVKQAYRQKGSR